MVNFVEQRTILFTVRIIVSMGQNEFESNRLQGVLRAKITVFL